MKKDKKMIFKESIFSNIFRIRAAGQFKYFYVFQGNFNNLPRRFSNL